MPYPDTFKDPKNSSKSSSEEQKDPGKEDRIHPDTTAKPAGVDDAPLQTTMDPDGGGMVPPRATMDPEDDGMVPRTGMHPDTNSSHTTQLILPMPTPNTIVSNAGSYWLIFNSFVDPDIFSTQVE